jgi:hypothetical protein
MVHKYVLLKTSWGVVIYIGIQEVINPVIDESSIPVADGIFVRISDDSMVTSKEVVIYILPAFRDLAHEIRGKVTPNTVCFDLYQIEFHLAHYQEEGLYCAIQEWIAAYYQLQINPIRVEYDKQLNKYIFEIPNNKAV